MKNTTNNTIEPNGNKFSLSLITGHNPGALLEVLSVFRNLKINLTKLESMPIPTSPFEYTFFIDGEVTKNEGNIWDMLKNGLHNQKVNFKFLGIYNNKFKDRTVIPDHETVLRIARGYLNDPVKLC